MTFVGDDTTRDHVFEEGLPDNGGPCYLVPSTCIVKKSDPVLSMQINAFVGSVLDGSYPGWLSRTSNYNAIISWIPEYRVLLDGCIDSTEEARYYAPSGSSNRAIYFGEPGHMSMTNHDASVVFPR